MYFSHIYLNVPFNYVFLGRLLYSAKGISATDILPVICLGSDVALNKSKFIIIIIIIIIITRSRRAALEGNILIRQSLLCGGSGWAALQGRHTDPGCVGNEAG